MNRTAVCLLLLSASWMVSARDVRMHGANGDGGDCPEAAAAAPAAPVATPAKPARSATTHSKVKSPPLFRGGGDDDAMPHMPRWHSFLPGMFR
jgi:hypothetical protein